MTMHPRVLPGRGCGVRRCDPDALGGESVGHQAGAPSQRGSKGKGNQVIRQPNNGKKDGRASKRPSVRQGAGAMA